MIESLKNLETILIPYQEDQLYVKEVADGVAKINRVLASLAAYIAEKDLPTATELAAAKYKEDFLFLSEDFDEKWTIPEMKASELYKYICDMNRKTVQILEIVGKKHPDSVRKCCMQFIPRVDIKLSDFCARATDEQISYIMAIIIAINGITSKIGKSLANCPYNFDRFVGDLLPKVMLRFDGDKKKQDIIAAIFDVLLIKRMEFSKLVREKSDGAVLELIVEMHGAITPSLAKKGLTVADAMSEITEIMQSSTDEKEKEEKKDGDAKTMD